MKFRFEDFLKNIIPGMILLIGICIYLIGYPVKLEKPTDIGFEPKEFSALIILIFLVLSYLLGYLNDGLSSWLEHYVIYGLFGNPSLRLLRGKGKRLLLVGHTAILTHLKTNCNLSSDSIQINDGFWIGSKALSVSRQRARLLFKHANDLKDGNSKEAIKEKLNESYYAYVFSRNLFFSYLFALILAVITWHGFLNVKSAVIAILLLIFLGFRRRDKSFYYSRSVLLACKY